MEKKKKQNKKIVEHRGTFLLDHETLNVLRAYKDQLKDERNKKNKNKIKNKIKNNSKKNRKRENLGGNSE